MKTKKPQSFKMQLLLFTLLICSTTQAQRWRLGGNSNLPAADDITAPGANQLGSQAGFNVPINFITNGTQRMVISGTTGFVGIGVTNPTDILHLHDGPNSALHITSTSTGSASNRGMKMGMLFNSTAGMITLQEANTLYFGVGGPFGTPTAKMNIQQNGNVGIGTGIFVPLNKLDVDNGDININTANHSYRIANNEVLWHKGNDNNIFVGVGSGFNNVTGRSYINPLYREGVCLLFSAGKSHSVRERV